MCMYYFYCCGAKFGLLKSAVVTMPDNARDDGAATSRLWVPISSRSSKRDAGLMRIGDVLSSLLEVRQSKETEELNRVKRQKYESKTYTALHDECMALHTRTSSGNLPPLLTKMNRQRMKRL